MKRKQQTEQLPIIDLSRLHEPVTRDALDLACRDWGFFYLINHGIDASSTDALLTVAKHFFHQPSDIKRKISRTEQNPWGYFDQELTKNRFDWKEVFDYGPQHGEKLVPRWPTGIPGFRLALMTYYRACEEIAFELLGAVSENLSMPRHFFDYLFEPEHTSFARINYYPPCPDPESPAAVEVPSSGFQGINHHTDAGMLTILLQDQQAGLEVNKGGRWHLIEPIPGALVVNIGDIAQVCSNDRYRAALHRVRANSVDERFSVPFFLNPAYSASYAPCTSVGETETAHYSSINWGEFRAARTAGDYQDLGEEIQIAQFRY